jgi:hypothetical protein
MDESVREEKEGKKREKEAGMILLLYGVYFLI